MPHHNPLRTEWQRRLLSRASAAIGAGANSGGSRCKQGPICLRKGITLAEGSGTRLYPLISPYDSGSACGDYEVPDLNCPCLEVGTPIVELTGRELAWLDAGNQSPLVYAANIVRTTEERHGPKMCRRKELAWWKGFRDGSQLKRIVERLLRSVPGEDLLRVVGGRNS